MSVAEKKQATPLVHMVTNTATTVVFQVSLQESANVFWNLSEEYTRQDIPEHTEVPWKHLAAEMFDLVISRVKGGPGHLMAVCIEGGLPTATRKAGGLITVADTYQEDGSGPLCGFQIDTPESRYLAILEACSALLREDRVTPK